MTELLQHYVASRALDRPERIAVVDGDRRISYGELDELSDRLAAALRQAGCRRGDRVGLLAPHGAEAVFGLLGVYKAGCVAVPLDSAGPAARLGRTLRSCEPSLVLAAGPVDGLLRQLRELGGDEGGGWDGPIGWLDEQDQDVRRETVPDTAFTWTDVLRGLASAPGPRNRAEDAAHILYTSGSTGTPKGIVITHANLIHFVEWGVRAFDIGPEDRNSGHTPLHFDLSTFDLFGTFAAGAELHIVPRRLNLRPPELAAFIRDARLTQWFSVPSVLGYLRRFDGVPRDGFPDLRRVIWCGDVLPTPTLRYWMERLPRASFTNLYGPTETTVASSHHTVESPPADSAEVPIGTACDGEELMVLDDSMQPVPAGDIGELYIGGPGLSPGYWREPERTRAAFVPHPGRPGDRLYRTGDLARRGDDGLLYFVGRTDSQIKSRGYRIELGEIEHALHAVGLVADCVVVAIPTEEFEGSRICCAYVSPADRRVTPKALRSALRRQLPDYMLPSRWLEYRRLPVNPNGKTDRPALERAFAEEDDEDAPAAA